MWHSNSNCLEESDHHSLGHVSTPSPIFCDSGAGPVNTNMASGTRSYGWGEGSKSQRKRGLWFLESTPQPHRVVVKLNEIPRKVTYVQLGHGSSTVTPQFSSVQSLSRDRLFVTPWIAARQASLSITNSQSLLKLMSIEFDAIQPSHPPVVPFSSCPYSLPASESFPMSQLLPWGGQSTGVSAATSVL